MYRINDRSCDRFDCRDLEWVPNDAIHIDCLGMLVSMDSERSFLEYMHVNLSRFWVEQGGRKHRHGFVFLVCIKCALSVP